MALFVKPFLIVNPFISSVTKHLILSFGNVQLDWILVGDFSFSCLLDEILSFKPPKSRYSILQS